MTVSFEHHERLLYRVPEVAGLLGLGLTKTWELVYRGDLESLKVDGSRRVTRQAVEAYIERQQAASAQPHDAAAAG